MLPKLEGPVPKGVREPPLTYPAIKDDLCLSDTDHVTELMWSIAKSCPEYMAFRLEYLKMLESKALGKRLRPNYASIRDLAQSDDEAVTSKSPQWSNMDINQVYARLYRAIDQLISPETRANAGESPTGPCSLPTDVNLVANPQPGYRAWYIGALCKFVAGRFYSNRCFASSAGHQRLVELCNDWQDLNAPDWNINAWIQENCKDSNGQVTMDAIDPNLPGQFVRTSQDSDGAEPYFDLMEDVAHDPSRDSSHAAQSQCMSTSAGTSTVQPLAPDINPSTSIPVSRQPINFIPEAPGSLEQSSTQLNQPAETLQISEDLVSNEVDGVNWILENMRNNLPGNEWIADDDTKDLFKWAETLAAATDDGEVRSPALERLKDIRRLVDDDVTDLRHLDGIATDIDDCITSLEELAQGLRSKSLEDDLDKKIVGVCDELLEVLVKTTATLENAHEVLRDIHKVARCRISKARDEVRQAEKEKEEEKKKQEKARRQKEMEEALQRARKRKAERKLRARDDRVAMEELALQEAKDKEQRRLQMEDAQRHNNRPQNLLQAAFSRIFGGNKSSG